MDPGVQRDRPDQIRAAKRALRQFQRRRAQEQRPRSSRTVRASWLLQGVESPTMLTHSLKETNSLGTAARQSAVQATDKSRRRRSRPASIRLDAGSDAGSARASRTLTLQALPPTGTTEASEYRQSLRTPLAPPTGPGSSSPRLPSELGVAGRRWEARPSSISRRPPPSWPRVASQSSTASPVLPSPRLASDSTKRHSRHSRQLSIATRGEGFELMAGVPWHDTDASSRSGAGAAARRRASARTSFRMSLLEPASSLFDARSSIKPLPPIPHDSVESAQSDSDEADESQGRLAALDKLEGRTSSPQKDTATPSRSPVPSWYGAPRSASLQHEPSSQEAARARRAARRTTVHMPSTTLATLGELEPSPADLTDEAEQLLSADGRSAALSPAPLSSSESSATARQASTSETETLAPGSPQVSVAAGPAPPRDADATPAPTSPKEPHSVLLRPLRLSLLASGTSAPPAPPRNAAAGRRISSITYTVPPVAEEPSHRDAHEAKSSRSAQSTTASWSTSEPGVSVFSPKSNMSDSPGATSIDSVDHTPRKGHGAAAADTSLQARLCELEREMNEQRMLHQHEVAGLQRELEDVRHMMGAQLAAVTQARDAAHAQCAELSTQMNLMQETLCDTSGERDMYRDDIVDWRTRCSDLEHTIQKQRLHLDQARSWRLAALRRMQAMRARLAPGASSGSDSSLSGAAAASEDLAVLPDLPELTESADLSPHVSRMLSKHSSSGEDAPDLAPATVQLLTDMREQILTLYASLKLEKMNHALTREQLEHAQAGRAVPGPEPAPVSPQVDREPGTPTAVQTPMTSSTPRRRSLAKLSPPPKRSETEPQSAPVPPQFLPSKRSAARRPRPVVLEAAFPAPLTTETPATPQAKESEPQFDATADVLFGPGGAAVPGESLRGLGLVSSGADQGVAELSWADMSAASAPPTSQHAHTWSLESLGLGNKRRPRSEERTPRDAHDVATMEAVAAPPAHVLSEPAWPDHEASYSLEEGAGEASCSVDLESGESFEAQADPLAGAADDEPHAGLAPAWEEAPCASGPSGAASPCMMEPQTLEMALLLSESPLDDEAAATSPDPWPVPHDTEAATADAGPDTAIPGLDDVAPYDVPDPGPEGSEGEWQDVPADSNEWLDAPAEPAPLSASAEPDTTQSSAWVSDDELEEAEAEPSDPPTPRPEFIPEWSFEQATYEAKRDVQVFELAGRRTVSRFARRGARRLRRTPVDDFFGILKVSAEPLPALPMPSYALAPPPVQDKQEPAPLAKRSAMLTLPAAPVGRTALHDDSWASLEDWQPSTGHTPAAAHDPYSSWTPPTWQRAPPPAPVEVHVHAGDDDPGAWADDGTDMALPATPEMADTHLAPPFPAPSTPVPRSPGDDLTSPRGPGRARYVKRNLTRIPVPSRVWELDFTHATATPGAGPLVHV